MQEMVITILVGLLIISAFIAMIKSKSPNTMGGGKMIGGLSKTAIGGLKFIGGKLVSFAFWIFLAYAIISQIPGCGGSMASGLLGTIGGTASSIAKQTQAPVLNAIYGNGKDTTMNKIGNWIYNNTYRHLPP